MNYIRNDNHTIIVLTDTVEVDGRVYELPQNVKQSLKKENEIVVQDDEIYINEFRFDPETGQFERVSQLLYFIMFLIKLIALGLMIGYGLGLLT